MAPKAQDLASHDTEPANAEKTPESGRHHQQMRQLPEPRAIQALIRKGKAFFQKNKQFS